MCVCVCVCVRVCVCVYVCVYVLREYGIVLSSFFASFLMYASSHRHGFLPCVLEYRTRPCPRTRLSSHLKYNFTPCEGTGIRSLITHASDDCKELIEKLIAYNPEDRYVMCPFLILFIRLACTTSCCIQCCESWCSNPPSSSIGVLCCVALPVSTPVVVLVF